MSRQECSYEVEPSLVWATFEVAGVQGPPMRVPLRNIYTADEHVYADGVCRNCGRESGTEALLS